ncbi:hypothetical protein SCL_1566 [Sulfuricaulis limicola]|uniref:PEP-CTERM protein-sorting domain-containing protein n=1 Tax=Sulfuricaulis limicola TaxID=1620215 RepID=A0A1B4XGE9_9GAMM|nr:VPLPA-CTERM sorting domain-containing protein [Sulfuricaulis limicola]BAV33871.1 hypothetical protein SCL_1566 [Sulfuricaulis limicola]
MTTRKISLFAAISMALVSGSAFAAQTPYATFTGAGGVSNLTWLTPEGTGCSTPECNSYGGHGFTFGHTNDFTFAWDGTIFTSSTDYTGPGGASNATISSPTPLLGQSNWSIHGVQIFGPGTYSFDTSLGGGVSETSMLNMTVGAGQLGVHMLLDWNLNSNIDIVNVWNINSTFSNCGSSTYDEAALNCLWTGTAHNPAGNHAGTVFLLASTDNDGDGTLGIPMVEGGPFYDPGFGGHNFNFNLQGSMTVVPVPAAVWLFGSGLLGLVGMARRKKKN